MKFKATEIIANSHRAIERDSPEMCPNLPIEEWLPESQWSDSLVPEHGEIKGREYYRDVLTRLHQKTKPKFYLEIGVENGSTLRLARCRAIGVDPAPMIEGVLDSRHRVVTSTSDQFFTSCRLPKKIDLAFIDGMHLAEFAVRDFINIERNSRKSSVIVIDDIFPNHPIQAERARQTGVWMGDIWKLPFLLEKFRPDLQLTLLDTSPSGLMLVKNLNPSSMILQDSYQEILREIQEMTSVPSSVFTRSNAVLPSTVV
jgi:hypothetical protein